MSNAVLIVCAFSGLAFVLGFALGKLHESYRTLKALKEINDVHGGRR